MTRSAKPQDRRAPRDRRPRRKKGRPRGPAEVTAASLEAAALRYLARYASSAANLRRILLARVARAARAHGTGREAGAALVEALVARLETAGLLDDAAYAEAKARSLHALGYPPPAIRARLAAKGVARRVTEDALARLAEETRDAELAAACRYVRRRRLGPYRRPEDRAPRRDKDLAAMARAGFTLPVARRVLAAGDAEAVEDMLRGAE